jgi:hypothetical protein
MIPAGPTTPPDCVWIIALRRNGKRSNGGNMGIKKTVLLLLLVMLSMGAGIEIGWMWTPLQKFSPASPATQPSSGPRPWFDQLELTADQQKQMDKIWGDTRQQMQALRDQDRLREQAFLGGLNTEQRQMYDKINQQLWSLRQAFDKERESLIADANAKSRALLNPTQQERWDILSKQMHHWHRPMGNATQHSTTMPSHMGMVPFEGEDRHQ